MGYRVKCIALDMDKTTLGKNRLLPERNREAILHALRHGVQVVIASGRPYCALPEDVLSIPGIEYAIVGNGCTVYRGAERIWESFLPEASVLAILSEAERLGLVTEGYLKGIAYADAAILANPAAYGFPDYAVPYLRSTRRPIENMPDFLRRHAGSLDAVNLVVSDAGLRRQLWDRLSATVPDIYITSSTERLLEISSASSGKGAALNWLITQLGISPEETAAFGDNENDADMLRLVRYGVAVENATDGCKAAASYHTAHHDACGVADAFERLLYVRDSSI